MLSTLLQILGAGVAGTVVGALLNQRLTARSQLRQVSAERARLQAAHAVAVADIAARAAEDRAREAAQLAAQGAEALKRQHDLLAAALAPERALLERDQHAAAAERERLLLAEDRLAKREQAVAGREATLQARDTSLDRKLLHLDQREARLREHEQALASGLADLERRQGQLLGEQAAVAIRLAEVAGMTAVQAKGELLASLDQELISEQSERIARREKDFIARSKELAVEIVSRAIQRYAAEHTADTTTAKVKLADEELKGRIIGKEGRNIKAFEQATGVDIIIEEGQPVITVSCFDPVRREVARRTLEILVDDGRIHPARIEEVLTKVQLELDRELIRYGEDAAFAVEVSGLHPQLIRLLGKLHFRTSYGQNVLKHTQEVAFLCGAMASDLGLDPKLGRRCGLLHDIGKAIDHEQEGSHPQLGYEALKRCGESEIVANAALAHHEGHQVLSAYTVIAAAADAISAARPGARSESSERYIKRLQQLEDIACSFKGVQKAYAIQAGRELRVIINAHTLADQEMAKVARDIARAIEHDVQFPGEVKVTLIRETRQIAVAR